MSPAIPADSTVPVRREPPHFRKMSVSRVASLSAHMVRVTFGGAELEGLGIPAPAASVRLLIPSSDEDAALVIPTWSGNEFLLPDGQRPIIRTFTPRYKRHEPVELDLDVVLHDGGATSTWVRSVQPGAPAAVSGTGRGYEIDHDVSMYLLAGDETAIPAISQLVEAMPAHISVRTIIEVRAREAKQELPRHPSLDETWVTSTGGSPPGGSLVAAIADSELGSGCKVWVAGEAAAMHRVRGHLFNERGLVRADATVRGYWKHGR